MAIIGETAILLNVAAVEFTNEKTGELVRGVTITLCRQAEDAKYEGVGYYSYKLKDFGEQGYRKAAQFLEQAKGLYMKPVTVDCEMRIGAKTRLIPVAIHAATASVTQLAKAG